MFHFRRSLPRCSPRPCPGCLDWQRERRKSRRLGALRGTPLLGQSDLLPTKRESGQRFQGRLGVPVVEIEDTRDPFQGRKRLLSSFLRFLTAFQFAIVFYYDRKFQLLKVTLKCFKRCGKMLDPSHDIHTGKLRAFQMVGCWFIGIKIQSNSIKFQSNSNLAWTLSLVFLYIFSLV